MKVDRSPLSEWHTGDPFFSRTIQESKRRWRWLDTGPFPQSLFVLHCASTAWVLARVTRRSRKECLRLGGRPSAIRDRSLAAVFLFFLLFLFASDIIIWWWLLPAHLSCKANRPCLTWISFFQFFSFSKERNNIIGVNVVLCAGSWVNFNDSIHHISADWPISQCSVLLLTDYRSTATEDANSSRTFGLIRSDSRDLNYITTRGSCRYCRIFFHCKRYSWQNQRPLLAGELLFRSATNWMM